MSDTGIGAIVNEENEEVESTKRAVQKAINSTTPIIINQITGNLTPQQHDQKIADLKAEDERYKTEEIERIGREIRIITGNETPEETQRKIAEVKQMIKEHHEAAEMLGVIKQNPDQQNATQGPEIPSAKVMSGTIAVNGKSEKPILTKQQELRTATKEGTSSHE